MDSAKENFFVKFGVSRKLVQCASFANLRGDIRQAFRSMREFPSSGFKIQFQHRDLEDEFIVHNTQLIERANKQPKDCSRKWTTFQSKK